MPALRSLPGRVAISLCALTLLGACAGRPLARDNAPVYGGVGPSQSQAVTYGVVRGVEPLGPDRQPRPGAGAVIGGVVGGVIGRQMGESNRGRNAATAVGALVGAVIGNQIEKGSRERPGPDYGVRVTVSLDDGRLRRFDLRDADGLQPGDRVRIDGSRVERVG